MSDRLELNPENVTAIDNFFLVIDELRKYKKLYEHQSKDKQRMSDELFELMMREYNTTPYDSRVKKFKKETCRCCRGVDYCDLPIPDDILMPMKSNRAWIPTTKSCKEFEWR